MTICADVSFLFGVDEEAEAAELRDAAIREGIRRANVTSGYGSIAIEVNEESVAPWWSALVFMLG